MDIFQISMNWAVENRAGKSSKMSERGLLLGVKYPQSCIEEFR